MSEGFGALIHLLGGGTEHSASEYYGLTVKAATLVDDVLTIEFDGGKTIRITDNGQSCCESRYMTSDDDLKELVGQQLQKIDVEHTNDSKGYYDVHEIAFLRIQGDKSGVTVATHNIHNGYYGGFALNISEVPSGPVEHS